MRYIAVSSNCQSAGIVGCLKELFPRDQITVSFPLFFVFQRVGFMLPVFPDAAGGSNAPGIARASG
ncbi:hypothetical protein, partial [Thauera aromatica]|uniref:hypothetical protein n=1 Tax=Thauera aromatica TaxID=59405 RepID=UPI001FFD62FB